jgi:hypothetical protein
VALRVWVRSGLVLSSVGSFTLLFKSLCLLGSLLCGGIIDLGCRVCAVGSCGGHPGRPGLLGSLRGFEHRADSSQQGV